ncbi:hypothetical protein [Massilia sp. AB1]|uniref:RIFT barrel domain-containing protein n=1 Tax=Massilia sp. AB1 TaxID=2823371 RepID=UPI001E2D5B8C|nr:hypothetical protein [Massilia sp. AB1]
MIITALSASMALMGCGNAAESTKTLSNPLLGSRSTAAAGSTTPTGPTTSPSTTLPSTAVAITTVQLTSTAAQTRPTATFGQAFAQGHVPAGSTLVGQTAAGAAVPLQVDAKARHPDGSLRHAVITVQLPSSTAGQVETIKLVKSTTAAAATTASPTTLLNSGFTASFNATVGGVVYSASADALLKSGKYTTWLSGSLANEWIVSAPLKTAAGVEHPHLSARFAIRFYPGSNNARVDVAIENGWAYEAAPQNAVYNAQLLVGGQSVFSQAAMTHYHHARWRKVAWWGKEPALNVRHDAAYLIGTKALPNYDQSLKITETTIASWVSKWNGAKTGPMQSGVANPYMPATGARPELGLLPAWSALYLLSMDERMKKISLGMSDQAGSWSIHYRNKQTGRPVTLAEFPYAALGISGDSKNPVTKLNEGFPACPQTVCATPLTADTSHQAAFAYLPYLVTGDYYHLEELQFWANYNSISGNPGYRQNLKGLVKSDQVRGQAWSLRTLSEAAYITPDNDPQKANFAAMVNHNIDWYDANYTNNTAANKLGALEHGYAIVYNTSTGLAPWQDDFFTASVGRMVELGFTRAQPLLKWKASFPVNRMVGDGYCWIEAPAYSLKVRDSATSPLYTSMKQVYAANHTATFLQLDCASTQMASSLGLKAGQMTGYVTVESSQSIMRPALAYSVGVDANGRSAYDLYAKRPYQPDYATSPQFAIVPR